MEKKSVHIAKLIKEKRMELGLSQIDLAHALGFTRTGGSQSISNVERGLCQFPMVHAEKLCGVLNVSSSVMKELFVLDYAARINSNIGSENVA